MQGVDIVIIMMSTQPHWMAGVSQEFFMYLFTENLAENCRHVVVRITNSEDGKKGGRRQSRSQGKLDSEMVMKSYGFEKEKVTKAKLCKLVSLHVVFNYCSMKQY